MDEKALRRLLRVKEPTAGRRGWRCPGDVTLAAYVEHRVSTRQESRIESHLADCTVCLEQVAFLARHSSVGESSVAPQAISRARDLVPFAPTAWRSPVLRWGPIVATAACVVLVVSLQLRQSRVPALPSAPQIPAVPATAPGGTPAVTPGTTAHPSAAAPPDASSRTTTPAASTLPVPLGPPPTERKSLAKPLSLVLVSPAENATLAQRDLEFRWQAVPGSIYYEIHVVTEDGDVAWQNKVESTSTRLPAGHPLQSDTKYFVWVRAYLSGGGTVKSPAVSFRVGGE